MTDAHDRKPYELSLVFQQIAEPSKLIAPYNLFVEYDGTVSAMQRIVGAGFQSSQLGFSALSYTQKAITSGFHLTAYGKPDLYNKRKSVTNATVGEQDHFSKPKIYNLKQFIPLNNRGVNSALYGTAALLGGVRYIKPSLVTIPTINKPVVVNTTANQTVRVDEGIKPIALPGPILTPHMIYAGAIYGTSFGSAKLIPTPVLRHKGVNQMLGGTPTVWFRVRKIGAIGFDSYSSGYGRAFDPTQFVRPQAFVRTAVFGDTYLKNKWSFLTRAGAIDGQSVSPWSVIENKNRRYDLKGFASQSFGQQSIRNKTPSIFFNGINPPVFYQPAIGHRIRKVFAVGFDRLAFGISVLTKTPEILPRGYNASAFGDQQISNYRRYIENTGKDHSATAIPRIWFRYRYAEPKSWQSSNFSNSATVTHGVRELIAQGFIRHGYGMAWVTPAVRLLAPESIYKNYPGAHYVGRHQEIKPQPFVATLFGTRIIPESKSVYPLGFIGKFGDNKAYLRVQYLKPKGYLSAGEQPAFRWGRQIAYNKTSYIIQNFLGDSGLVPPKWSEWTAIANRNKVIGAIGTPMQKFGYSQVDNNARLIQPVGLLATNFDKSMIAERVRPLPIVGIEAPLMTSWHVAYNAARVISPKGSIHTLTGNAEAVKTRRYYDRVGRIDSFESGTAMIAYRIRRLEIEKRYSIAPPLINLSSVALYTRYVSFNGYETAKYGLASLSIHFRIITPRWAHVERVGSPALRNVTPELLSIGHDSQAYGVAKIRTQWRNVYAVGSNASLIGLLKISDTKQHLSVTGFVDSLASQKHTVVKTASAPYSKQYIFLNDENGDDGGEGFGIKPPGIPIPFFNQNVLYHEGHLSSKFGTQFIWGNNLVIRSGIAIDNVPNSLSVRNKNNVISLEGKGIVNVVAVGKPRLSPHTIYAVKEAPDQAKRNHLVSGLHYVGEFDKKGFGNPKLESTIRAVYPRWSVNSYLYNVGKPTLTSTLTIVYAEGFRLGRFGVPKIPFTLQTVESKLGLYSTLFGTTSIKRPPYIGPQTLLPKGVDSFSSGAHLSDNFIRTLEVSGKDSLIMGQRKNNDTPYMWQGLRVGEHVPLIIGGNDMSRYGATVIGLRVRDISVSGIYAFNSEYEMANFYSQLKVSNADKQLPQTKSIKLIGIASANGIGYQDVKLGQRYIRPDGNSDQFRKGGYHA